MNVVDSSGWVEYFTGGPNAKFFEEPIEATVDLVVPTLSLFEVFKRVLRERGESVALELVAHMMQGRVVDLDATLALAAAKLATELRLAMADAVILATARASQAVLWTQDSHFEGLEDVRYCPRPGNEGTAS